MCQALFEGWLCVTFKRAFSLTPGHWHSLGPPIRFCGIQSLELQQARAGSPQLPSHPQPGFLLCLYRGWVNARLLDLTACPTNRVCFLQSESGAGVTGLCGWATRDKRLGACQSCSWGLSAIEPRLVSLPQHPGTRAGERKGRRGG